jgi:GAF domain-containing protein
MEIKNSDLLTGLKALLGAENNAIANCANFSAYFYENFEEVNWVGFYFYDGRELVLGPFAGKTACIRIAMGKGVCGTAAANKRPLVVPDVHKFPGHIACDEASNSEIVLPIIYNSRLIGVLDIDSPELNRFDEEDTKLLESALDILSAQSDMEAITAAYRK